MEISCNCSADVDEYPAVSSYKIRTARKIHKCCECGSDILQGKKYEYVTMLYEGHWDDYKTCSPCLAIRKRYCPDGYYFGMLREAISECLGMDYVTGYIYWEDEDE